MNKVFDLGQFDLDLTLRDASLDPLVSPTRRSLANASIGVEAFDAYYSARELYEAAVAIADKSWSMSSPVRLLSVTAATLSDCCTEQMTLIGDTTEEKMKNAKLDRAMDSIRSRYGKQSFSYARLVKKPEE